MANSPRRADVPPPEVMEKFIENQSRQIALQEKQMALNEKNSQNQYEYAKEALKHKTENATQERAHNSTKLTKIFVFSGVIFLVFLIFIIELLRLGYADIAKEIFQVITFNITGAIGGYGFASFKKGRVSASTE